MPKVVTQWPPTLDLLFASPASDHYLTALPSYVIHHSKVKMIFTYVFLANFKDTYIAITLCSGGLDTNLQPGGKKDTLVSSSDKTFSGAISSIQRNDDSWLGTEVTNDVVLAIFIKKNMN